MHLNFQDACTCFQCVNILVCGVKHCWGQICALTQFYCVEIYCTKDYSTKVTSLWLDFINFSAYHWYFLRVIKRVICHPIFSLVPTKHTVSPGLQAPSDCVHKWMATTFKLEMRLVRESPSLHTSISHRSVRVGRCTLVTSSAQYYLSSHYMVVCRPFVLPQSKVLPVPPGMLELGWNVVMWSLLDQGELVHLVNQVVNLVIYSCDTGRVQKQPVLTLQVYATKYRHDAWMYESIMFHW